MRNAEAAAMRKIATHLARRSVTAQILAGERGLIPRRVELGRDRGGFMPRIVKGGEPCVLPGVAQDEVVMRVLPAQYRRARWTAERRGHEEPRERRTLLCQETVHRRH